MRFIVVITKFRVTIATHCRVNMMQECKLCSRSRRASSLSFLCIVSILWALIIFWYGCVKCTSILYRVFQEERSIIWEVIVSVILRKKVYMNMSPIPNGFRQLARSILNLASNIFLPSRRNAPLSEACESVWSVSWLLWLLLIGPVILEDRMTGHNYLEFMQNELPEQLEDVPVAIRIAMYFQHDGAPPHCTRLVMQHLGDTFPNR
jgi:hypothetical protein